MKTKKQTSIVTNIVIIIGVVMLLLAAVNALSLYLHNSNAVEKSISAFGMDLARNAAAQVDIGTYQRFLENPVEGEDYWSIRNQLDDIRKKMGAKYIYTIQVDEAENVKLMIDGLPKGEPNAAEIGDEASTLTYKELVPVLNGGTASQPIVHDAKYNEDYLSAFAPLVQSGKVVGILGVDIDASAVQGIISKVQWESLPATLSLNLIVSFLAAICLALFIRRRLRPLRQISEKAGEVSAGKLAEADFAYSRKDEIGLIMDSFSQMIAHLRELIGDVKTAAGQMDQMTDEMARSMQNVEEQALAIGTASSEIARGNEQTARSVEAISGLNGELTDKIQNVNQQVQDMQRLGRDVLRTGEESRLQLESFLSHSRETSAQLRQVNSGMERLVQKSADIGSVVTTIQEIAGQTNLLALNAAIESARAGEAGKGFAVVAQEVRKLAEKTSEATLVIQRNVQDVIGEVNRVISELELTMSKYEEESEKIKGVSDGVSRLAAITDALQMALEQVVVITDEMSRFQQSIRQDVLSVTAVSEQTAASAEEVTATIQEVGEHIRQVAREAEEVAVHIRQLRQKTDIFVL